MHAWHPSNNYVRFLRVDFARKEKIMLPNLTEEQVEDHIRQAVLDGENKPRAYYQSQAPLRLPTIVD